MTDERPDNVLFDWYERYIGEPETETDVYLGFGLFFVSISFALLALLLFVAGTSMYGIREDGYFTVAEPAYALGMLSLPLAMFSIVVLLPVKQRATVGAGLGVAIAVAAIVAFVSVYPDNWFDYGTAQTLNIVGAYAVGLTIVTGATGAALVAHQLERVRAPAPSEIREPEAEPETEHYSEEEIERDIEEAMADVEMTWGGVERSENRELKLTTDFADQEIEAGGVNVEANTHVESGGVDTQVDGLRNLKGGDTQTATSESTVDDQTAALNELKRQKEEDQVPENAPTRSGGVVSRLLGMLGLS